MAMKIGLTQGKSAIVDDEDFPELARYRWHARRHKNKWYACRTVVDGKDVYMHRLLMGSPQGVPVGHVNGDGLDNRRENIRVATRGLCAANVGRQRKGSSVYRGVYWHAAEGRWRATVTIDGRQRYLGYFDDEVSAARAYDVAAKAAFGEFAHPNFPEANHG
jgi:hypothetical protein